MINSELKDRLVDTIALLGVPGVGRGRFSKLVAHFGSAKEALAAPLHRLKEVPGFSEKTVTAIKNECDPDQARRTAAIIAQLGWSVLFPDTPGYPELLSRCHDCPPMLFARGLEVGPDEKMLAIVGTRHASEAGRRFAHNLAGDLARAGITVVSGMAEGIDSAAHRGALDAGGRTIAVWGTPLDRVYPPSNKDLAEQIEAHGAIFSEYLPGVEPNASNFPERNRIISGLSEGVIVVEAGQRSGALITANDALEQNRELFAVPGGPYDRRTVGTNQLIKAGAKLVTGVDDILDEIPRLKGEITARRFKQIPDLTEIERKVVDSLASGEQQIDQLCRTIELPVSELMEYLLALELKGVVEELPGKRFVLSGQ